jgi:hypothetical protein
MTETPRNNVPKTRGRPFQTGTLVGRMARATRQRWRPRRFWTGKRRP